MKTILALLLIPCLALATGWDNRVDYYKQTHVDGRLYAISENGGVYTVSQWDTNSLGATPSIAQLTATPDAVVDAWCNGYAISIRQTPAWAAVTNAMVPYAMDKDTSTNAIAQVTDAKTKAALNTQKALIQDLQAEIIALKHLVGNNMMVEP